MEHDAFHVPYLSDTKASGARSKRPGLDACLEELQQGDVLRLDRLGRSMPHLVALVAQLRHQGIGFRSIGDGAIDTTTASGELVFHIFSTLGGRILWGFPALDLPGGEFATRCQRVCPALKRIAGECTLLKENKEGWIGRSLLQWRILKWELLDRERCYWLFPQWPYLL